MKVLVTGANGYIGTRLVPMLVDNGHEVCVLVRGRQRLDLPDEILKKLQIIEADLLEKESLEKISDEIDAAYYLVHSMTTSSGAFAPLEEKCARNFSERMEKTKARQIIYLSGLANEENLSKHLSSRRQVEVILRQGKVPVTTLMAGIIIGSGSASFEIIRDLVEKLPVMITPRWVRNLVQPIAISDVLGYLIDVLGHQKCLGKRFEIGGPDVLSYKEVLLQFARIRGLKRWLVSLPVLTPKLSSYWLYFMTSANYYLASSLVESLKNNAICKEHEIEKIFPKKLLSFEQAVKRAFEKIERDDISSSWKDALGDSSLQSDFSIYTHPPRFGVFFDRQVVNFSSSPDQVLETIWSLGGENGWLYMNWCWVLRGAIDRLLGGVGLRRGRTHEKKLKEGDSLDFWRVLLADKANKRLLLYAEMKMPGEAWLEFQIKGQALYQTATFRPRGIWGRIYWYALWPFHELIFRGMARSIVNKIIESKRDSE